MIDRPDQSWNHQNPEFCCLRGGFVVQFSKVSVFKLPSGFITLLFASLPLTTCLPTFANEAFGSSRLWVAVRRTRHKATPRWGSPPEPLSVEYQPVLE